MKKKLILIASLIFLSSLFIFAGPNEDLMKAVKKGNLRGVKRAVRRRANLNIRERQKGRTPLHIAAERGYLKIVKYLIHKGVKADITDRFGITPLHLTAMKGQYKIARFLIKKGANVRKKNRFDETALYFACAAVPFFNNHYKIAELLIQMGASVKTAKGGGGDAPIHAAAIGNNLSKKKLIHLLLSKGADINRKGNFGNTPLCYAANYGSRFLLQYLIERGANVHVFDWKGESPLHIKAQKGDLYGVILLLNKGIAVNVKDKHGDTPLHHAVFYGRLYVIHYLIGKGANINAKNKYGNTPLHRIVSTTLITKAAVKRVLKTLMLKNPRTDIKNKKGLTPIDLAKKKGLHDLVRILLKKVK
ncbi:MAG: ankyrin repeat domain-containing protein [Spirochaetes bacterium]|nr:ankyrin repeat domain-containing protein [Spirochaetota bacterium]